MKIFQYLACFSVFAATPVLAQSECWRVEAATAGHVIRLPDLCDTNINVNYGDKGVEGLGVYDNFTVTFTATRYFQEGYVVHEIDSDDEGILSIDGVEVGRDNSNPPETSPPSRIGSTYVKAGTHTLRLTFIERTGLAYARLLLRHEAVTPGCPQEMTWIQSVYNTSAYEHASPVYTAQYCSSDIKLNYGQGAPAGVHNPNDFAVTLEAFRYFRRGWLDVTVHSDDFGVFYFGDSPNDGAVDDSGPDTGSFSFKVPHDGHHRLRFYLKEFGGDAFANVTLRWRPE